DVERFYAELLTEVRALPGVTRAGAIFGLPMSDFGYSISVEIIDGRDLETEESHSLSVQVRVVTSDFLETIQAPLLRGRGITEADRYGAPPVVVVSESAARLLWPNEDALGRTFEIGTTLGIRRGNRVGGEVIGVVRDIKGQGLDADARPKIYASHSQFPTRYMGIAVRSEGDPATTIGPIRRWLAARDPALPMFEVASLGELVNASIAQRRFYMLLLTAFALTALALASVGVYGVMSYSVARRTNEFGIRMALGASPEELLSLVLRRGFVLALAGVGIGVVASFASTRLLANLLFGTSAVDPATFLAVAALLTGVALLACFVPARRATRVDPLVALKYE
ncbi:MAG: FtsX-like permease family protein, partial [Gemmatimonadota bacterium]